MILSSHQWMANQSAGPILQRATVPSTRNSAGKRGWLVLVSDSPQTVPTPVHLSWGPLCACEWCSPGRPFPRPTLAHLPNPLRACFSLCLCSLVRYGRGGPSARRTDRQARDRWVALFRRHGAFPEHSNGGH